MKDSEDTLKSVTEYILTKSSNDPQIKDIFLKVRQRDAERKLDAYVEKKTEKAKRGLVISRLKIMKPVLLRIGAVILQIGPFVPLLIKNDFIVFFGRADGAIGVFGVYSYRVKSDTCQDPTGQDNDADRYKTLGCRACGVFIA